MRVKGRILSFFLAILMFASVFAAFPPIEARAADGSVPTVKRVAPDVGSNYVTLKGKITANGGVAIQRYGFGYIVNHSSSNYNWSGVTDGTISNNVTFTHKITGLNPGDFVDYVIVAKNQYGEAESVYDYVWVPMKVSEDELKFTATGGSDTFTITSSSAYTISENLSWITVSPTSGSSSKTITVTCSNNVGAEREGTITVTHTGSGDTFEIEVYQEGKEEEIEVSEEELKFDEDGGTDTFWVYSSGSWSISDNQSWISVSPTSGSGDKKITVTCKENATSQDREGTITITDKSTSEKVTIDVYQEAAKLKTEFDFSEFEISKTVALGEDLIWEGYIYIENDVFDNVTISLKKISDGDYIYYRQTSVGGAKFNTEKILNGRITTGKKAPSGYQQDSNGNWYAYSNFAIDEVGDYLLYITASGKNTGEYDKKEYRFSVTEPDYKKPEVSLTVTPSQISLGESFTYSGTAYGKDYKLNTVSVSIGYFRTESDYEKYISDNEKYASLLADSVYIRYTDLNASSKSVSNTIKTGAGSKIRGEILNNNNEYISHEMSLANAGVYIVVLNAWSDDYGKLVKVRKAVIVEEPIEIPEVELTVSKTQINLGDSFTYSGTAYGNGYKLNTVSVSIGYFRTESDYAKYISDNEKYASLLADSVYIRYTGLNASSKPVSGTIKTGAGSTIQGYTLNNNNEYVPYEMSLANAGVYIVVLNAWSDVYGTLVKDHKPVVAISTTRGDLNGDGQITNKDRFLLNRYLANMTGYTNVDKTAADINGDGEITQVDVDILMRHLAAWQGYEDLSAFYNPIPPQPDSAVWNMSFSSNSLYINLKVKSGNINNNVVYQFIAENDQGKHYWRNLDLGKTEESFKITSIGLPRGRYYSFYVVPQGVVLDASNKAEYLIGRYAVPLYSGSMITSITSDNISLNRGERIYNDRDVTINWDGSYGIEAFELTISLNGKTIQQNFSHSGPGQVVVTAAQLQNMGEGEMTITAKVSSPYTNQTATTKWTLTILKQPEKVSVLVEKLNNTYFEENAPFIKNFVLANEELVDYCNNELSLGIAMTTDMLCNIADVYKYGDFETYSGTHALKAILDAMDAEYYTNIAVDSQKFLQISNTFIAYFRNKNITDSEFNKTFGSSKHYSELLSIRTWFRTHELSSDPVIEAEVQKHLQKMFKICQSDTGIRREFAKMYANSAKMPSFNEAMDEIMKVAKKSVEVYLGDCEYVKEIFDEYLGKIELVAQIGEIFYDIGFKDYLVVEAKLDVLISALENGSNTNLLKAAKYMKQCIDQSFLGTLNRIAEGMLDIGSGILFGGITAILEQFTFGINNHGDAVIVMADVLETILDIENYLDVLMIEYSQNEDASISHEMKKQMHALADCLALYNSLAAKLNEFWLFKNQDYWKLMSNSQYYKNCHTSIDAFFDKWEGGYYA
ncbi:MAG: hypothetical protein J6D87_06455 [Clostridia bacterium]|nr:hypothetical protein [Clostridia bacterium]